MLLANSFVAHLERTRNSVHHGLLLPSFRAASRRDFSSTHLKHRFPAVADVVTFVAGESDEVGPVGAIGFSGAAPLLDDVARFHGLLFHHGQCFFCNKIPSCFVLE